MNPFSLTIQQISLQLRSIYQAQFDNQQAYECLSNITKVILQLSQIKLQYGCFHVSSTTLVVKKFVKSDSRYQKRAIFQVPHLVISVSKNSTEISIKHDDVHVLCEKEEIALLGKLFSIINGRIRFENYQERVYQPFIGTIEIGEHASLLKNILKVINPPNIEQNQRVYQMHSEHSLNSSMSSYVQELFKNQPKTIEYTPRKVQFDIQMCKLIHRITLQNSSYRQQQALHTINHQLSIGKGVIQYRSIKQFTITDLKLYFEQTATLNSLSLLIDDITMAQNQQTLIDYMDSFTLLKKLLQFEDQKNQQQHYEAHKREIRGMKKVIAISTINMNYSNEIINVKKLQIEKQTKGNGLGPLYFSVNRCEVLLNRLPTNRDHINPVPDNRRSLVINRKSKFSQQRQQVIHQPTMTAMSEPIAIQKHCLFSVSSVTLRTIPEYRHQKWQERSQTHIKDPLLSLPQCNISNRIVAYLSSYQNMRSSLSAYILNLTDEKLQQRMRNQCREFLVEPISSHIKITNIVVKIADNPMDQHIIAFSRTIRTYLEHSLKYNQIEVLSNLRRNSSSKFDLFSLKIESIGLQMGPISSIEPNEGSVYRWITKYETMAPSQGDLQKSKSPIYQSKFDIIQSQIDTSKTILRLQRKRSSPVKQKQSKIVDRIRLRRVKAGKLNLKIKNIICFIRDYPKCVSHFALIQLQSEYLQKKQIFDLKYKYFQGMLTLGKVQLNIGLNLLSGISEITKKVTTTLTVINDYLSQTTSANDQFKSYHITSHKPPIGYPTWWHQLCDTTKWCLKVDKTSPSSINILSDHSPYNMQCFEIDIGRISGCLQQKFTVFNVEHIILSFRKSIIVNLADFEFRTLITFSKTLSAAPNYFSLTVTIRSLSRPGSLVLTSSLISYVSSMKQLSRDWLLIHGIHDTSSSWAINRNNQHCTLIHLQSQEQLSQVNYLQLARIITARQIKNAQNGAGNRNIMSYVSIFCCNVDIRQFYYMLNSDQYGCHMISNGFKAKWAFKPDHVRGQWKTIFSKISIGDLMGRIIKIKDLSKNQNSSQKQLQFCQYDQYRQQKEPRRRKQFQKDIFLSCSLIKIQFDRYFSHQRTISFVSNCLQAKQLKILISQQNKRIAQRIFEEFFSGVKKPFHVTLTSQKNKLRTYDKHLTKAPYIGEGALPHRNDRYFTKKQTVLNKFRKVVLLIIRINREVRQKIPSIDFVLSVQNVELILQTDQQKMVLRSQVPAILKVKTVFDKGDMYCVSPRKCVDFKFNNIDLKLVEGLNLNWFTKDTDAHSKRILTAEQFHLQIKKAAQNDLSASQCRCQFRSGRIQLEQQSKNMLKQIISFIVDMTNPISQQKKQYYLQTQKYSQMVNNTRKKLKEKLEWNQSDIKRDQPKESEWLFVLQQMELVLLQSRPQKTTQSDIVLQNMQKIIRYTSVVEHKIPFMQASFVRTAIKMDMHKQFTYFQIEISGLLIINQLEPLTSTYRELLAMKAISSDKGKHTPQKSQQNNQKSIHKSFDVLLRAELYRVEAFSDVIWDYFRDITIQVHPIKLRLTDKFKDALVNFLFDQLKPQNVDQYDDQIQYYRSRVPQYIKLLTFSPIVLQAWYRSDSMFKRMDGIEVTVETYKISQKLQTNKELFDSWAIFMAKQMLSQVFSIMGQKIFGGNSSEQDN